MATYTKVLLSGCTDGKGIKVVKTVTDGDLIHNAHATDMDEVWLWAFNSHTVSVILTIEFGGHSAPDQNIVVSIPNNSGLIPVVPGLILQNDLDINAFASVANVVIIYGFVNRIT